MRLDRDGGVGGADVKTVDLDSLKRDSGTYAKADSANGVAEEPPAIRLDAVAKLRVSVGETIDNLSSICEQFFLVLQRYTIEHQRVSAECVEKQQKLKAEKVILSRKLAAGTYSFGLFKLTTAKGKVVAVDLEKLTQSLAAIKGSLDILGQPARLQVEAINTLKENLGDKQFCAVLDELKIICDQVAVLLEVCFHLYSQLNSAVPVNSRKGKVGLNSDVWSDLHTGRIQVVNLEQFLRVVYLIATQNRHTPTSRTHAKKLLIDQLSIQNGADVPAKLDDDHHHIADNLMWTLFQTWTEPLKQKTSRQ